MIPGAAGQTGIVNQTDPSSGRWILAPKEAPGIASDQRCGPAKSPWCIGPSRYRLRAPRSAHTDRNEPAEILYDRCSQRQRSVVSTRLDQLRGRRAYLLARVHWREDLRRPVGKKHAESTSARWKRRVHRWKRKRLPAQPAPRGSFHSALGSLSCIGVVRRKRRPQRLTSMRPAERYGTSI